MDWFWNLWKDLSQGARDNIIGGFIAGVVLAIVGIALKQIFKHRLPNSSSLDQFHQPLRQEEIIKLEPHLTISSHQESQPLQSAPVSFEKGHQNSSAAQAERKHEIRKVRDTIPPREFDVFLSYSHTYVDWVERLAMRLEDEEGFQIWLDRWVLIPGRNWPKEMANGLYQAKCCVVCIGDKTPTGWFEQEIQRALNRQVKDPSFRVIPILLPDAEAVNVDDFLELRTWVDFRQGSDIEYAFYQLVCGVRGIPPGRWPSKEALATKAKNDTEYKLRELRRLKQNNLIDDDISLEFQRKLLDRHLENER
jgi:hypothetical protein